MAVVCSAAGQLVGFRGAPVYLLVGEAHRLPRATNDGHDEDRGLPSAGVQGSERILHALGLAQSSRPTVIYVGMAAEFHPNKSFAANSPAAHARALVDCWPGFPVISRTAFAGLAGETNGCAWSAGTYFAHGLQSDNPAYPN